MRRSSVVWGLTVLLVIGGCSHRSALHDRLNGTWQNDIFTATFDFPGQTYSGVAMGREFSEKLDLISEKGNVVVFRGATQTFVCQFQEDGTIMLTKEGEDGGIPFILKRSAPVN